MCPQLVSVSGQNNFTIREDARLFPRIPCIHADPLSADQAAWKDQPKPASWSIKDRLVYMYLTHNPLITDNPFSAAWYCQGIIFSMWHMTVRVLEERYLDLWGTDIFSLFPDENITWKAKEYQKFLDQLHVIRRIKKDYLDVCRKLDVDMNSSSDHIACSSKLRSWKWLMDRIDILEYQISNIMTVSTQRATVVESLHSSQRAISANEQARGVGRLTAFAAVLVPFTVVSGIFSMSGDYAVGQQRFWVFWAVVVPISCATVICLFFMMPISWAVRIWRRRSLHYLQDVRNNIKAKLV